MCKISNSLSHLKILYNFFLFFIIKYKCHLKKQTKENRKEMVLQVWGRFFGINKETG